MYRTFIFLWVIVEFAGRQLEFTEFFTGVFTINPIGFPRIYNENTMIRATILTRAGFLKNR